MTFFEKTEQEILEKGLKIASYDFNKPWGGFFVIEEAQSQKFADIYFENLNVENLRLAGKLSPKILLVKPGARLSWQYHFRRSETWKVHEGPVGIIRSLDNNQGELIKANTGQIITLFKQERHRLVGLTSWGVIAEFWQHTDASNPSNEDDIVRVEDDYFRGE
jgi:mannose-6-phosphate isomerase-like protein (cupin superfamily)